MYGVAGGSTGSNQSGLVADIRLMLTLPVARQMAESAPPVKNGGIIYGYDIYDAVPFLGQRFQETVRILGTTVRDRSQAPTSMGSKTNGIHTHTR